MNANNPSELAPVTVLQEDVDQWIQTFGVRYFNELTNMAQLTEEVAVLANLFCWVVGVAHQDFLSGEHHFNGVTVCLNIESVGVV